MMRLGLTSAILYDMNLAQLANFCFEARLKSVELMCWPKDSDDKRKYAGVTHVDVVDVIANGAGRVEDTLYDQGDTRISALGYYPNPLDPETGETVVGHLKKVIDAAAVLGVCVVNTFVGRNHHLTVEENWPKFLEVWEPLIKHAEDSGVIIGIENCPMKFTGDEWPGGKNLATSPVIWERMFSDIPSDNFGLNFDPSHFVLQRMNIVKAVTEFGPKIFHAHAKDLRVDTDRLDRVGLFADNPVSWHTPKIPGRGQVPWNSFFAALKDVGYHGDMTIEVEDPKFKTHQEREEAVLLSRDFLESYFDSPEDETAQA